MTNREALEFLIAQRDRGRIWVSTSEAATVLGCTPASLTNAANQKGTIGTPEFYWAGSVLKISVMSLIKFVAGGGKLKDVFEDYEVR